MTEQPDNEPLPIDPSINVIRFHTIYKTKKWWKAAVIGNVYGHNQAMIFLWILDEKTGKWKRKHKLSENSVEGWEQTKAAMDDLIKGGI